MTRIQNQVTPHPTAVGLQDLLLHDGPGRDQDLARGESILHLGLGLGPLVAL